MNKQILETTETDPRALRNVFNELWKVLNQDLTTFSYEDIKSCAKNIMNISNADNGIQAMLDFKDQAILLRVIEIFFHVKKTMKMEVLEDVIEIIHVIMESLEEDFNVNTNLIYSLMDIVVQSKFRFNAQIEAAKLLNLLLEKYPDIHTCHSVSKELFIKSFGICLTNAGDYELQASIIEAIYRMVSIDERINIAKLWFNEQQLQNAALAIRNEEFEMDCRRFLNFFNAFNTSNQRVFSFPVQCVSLGRYQLNKPIDFQISEFWLDINIGSKSISTYVQDDSMDNNSDWEMVVIKKEIIKDFRVNVNDEKIILIIKLIEPSYTLAPFCPESSEHYVKIIFTKQDKVITAIQQLLGEIKFVNAPVATSPNNLSTLWCRSSAAISPLNVQTRTISNEKVFADVLQNIHSTKDLFNKFQSPLINEEIQGICENTKQLKDISLNKSTDNRTDNINKISEYTTCKEKEKNNTFELSKVNSKKIKVSVAKNYNYETEKNTKKIKINKKTYENTPEIKVNIVENTTAIKVNMKKIEKTQEVEDEKNMMENKEKDKVIESEKKKTIQVNKNIMEYEDSKNLLWKDDETINENQLERVSQNKEIVHNINKNSKQINTNKNIKVANITDKVINTESNTSEIKENENQLALNLVHKSNNAGISSKPKFVSSRDEEKIKHECTIVANSYDNIVNKLKNKHDIAESIHNQPHKNQNNQIRKNIQENHDVDFTISKSLDDAKIDCSKFKKCKKLLQTKQVLFQDSPDESYIAPPICKPQLKSIQVEKKKISNEQFKNISSRSLEVFDFPDTVSCESEKKLNKTKSKDISVSGSKNNFGNNIDCDENEKLNESKDKVDETEGKSNKYPKRACKSKIVQYKDCQSDENTTNDEANKIEKNESFSIIKDAENDVEKKRKRKLRDGKLVIQSSNKDPAKQYSNKKSIKRSSHKEPIEKSLHKEPIKKSSQQLPNEEPINSSLNYTKECFKKITNGYEQLHTNLFDFEDINPNEYPSQEPWWDKKNKNPRIIKQYRLKHKTEVRLCSSLSSSIDSTPDIAENASVKNQYRLKGKTELFSPVLNTSESTPENVCIKKQCSTKRKADLPVSSLTCTQVSTPEIVGKKAKTIKNKSKAQRSTGKSQLKNKLKTKESEFKKNLQCNKRLKKVTIQCPKITNVYEISDFSESQDSIKSLQVFDYMSPVEDSSTICNIPKPVIPDNKKTIFYEKQEKFSPKKQYLISPEKCSEKSQLASSGPNFLDETPIGVPVEPKKKWLKDLNNVFNKIEANQYPPKKRLWKSPVVAAHTSVNVTPGTVDDEIDENKENKKPQKFLKRKSSEKNVSSLHLTPLTFDSNDENEDEDMTDNFAVFCKSILEKSSSKNQSSEQTQSLLVLNKLKEKTVEECAENCSPYELVPTFQEKQDRNYFKKNNNDFYASPLEVSSDCISPPDVYSPKDSKRPFMLCKSVAYNDNNITSRDSMMENNTSMDKFVCKVAKVTEKRLQSYLTECCENRSHSLNKFSELCSKEFHDWHFTSQMKEDQLKKTLKQLESIMTEHMHNEKKHIKHLSQFHNKYIEEQHKTIKVNEHKKSNMLTQLREEIRSIKLQMSNSVRETQITSFRRSLEMMLNKV